MKNRILFIAGARRSGTTLLKNLLENKEWVLQFPFETCLLQRYYTNKHLLHNDYFRNEFINNRNEGQQSVIANDTLFKEYNKKISEEFGFTFQLNINAKKFKETYLNYLDSHPLHISSIINALMKGLIESNSYTQEHYSEKAYFLFKSPEETEVFAQDCFKDLPGAKFIHILRHPYDNYTSIKSRRIVQYSNHKNLKNTKAIGGPENGYDFVSGFTSYNAMSAYLAYENQKKIGQEYYYILKYEDLLKNPEGIMKSIASFLEVSYSDDFLKPTLLGLIHKAGSHLNKNTEVLSPKTTFDHKKYFEITSENERNIHNYFLSLTKLPALYPDLQNYNRKSLFFSWLQKYKYETWKLYLWRMATLKGFPLQKQLNLQTSLNNRVISKNRKMKGTKVL